MNVVVDAVMPAHVPGRASLGRAVAVALVGVAAASVARVESCDRPRTSPAAIAWDGDGFVAAWQRSDPDGHTVYLRHLAELASGVTTVRDGTPVFRSVTSWAPPEVVSGPAGGLVIVSPWGGEQVAIPFDRHGAVTDEPHPLTGCVPTASGSYCQRLCRRPVATAEGFVVGHVNGVPTHHGGVTALSFLDRSGRTVRTAPVPEVSGLVDECAMALRGDELVVASRVTRMDHARGIDVRWLSLRDGSSRGVWRPGPDRALALVAYRDGVALLDADGDGLHVAYVTHEGVRDTVALPAVVDRASADLGVSARGLFVTWLAGGEVHVLGIDTGRDRSRRTARHAAGTRALGAGDRCISAWATGAGALQVLDVARCP